LGFVSVVIFVCNPMVTGLMRYSFIVPRLILSTPIFPIFRICHLPCSCP